MVRMTRRSKQSGFTLVELLIVVAIIGVLSTVGIPSFRRMVQKSKKSEAKVNLGGLYTAEQAFFSEYGGYGNHLARLGFNIDGNPANLTYVVGFVAPGCTSLVLAAGTTLPQNVAADPIGLSIAQSFPQYYTGAGPGNVYQNRPGQDPATGNMFPGSSSLGNNTLGAPGCAFPAAAAALYQAAPANNVYNFGAGGLNNRFVAMAYGAIAPGVSKTAPAAGATDAWGINQDRQMANVQDGVK